MNSGAVWLPALIAALDLAAIGCNASGTPVDVLYGAGTPIAAWAPAGAPALPVVNSPTTGYAGSAPGAVQERTPSPGSYANVAGSLAPAAGSGAPPSAGRPGTPQPAAAGSGGRATGGALAAAGSGGMPRAGSGAAGSGGAPQAGSPAAGSGGAPAATVSSLTFDVTTSAVGYQYAPKNVGAIWVQDASGKLVKSLEVWAATRRRYLTRYTSALAGSTVDVTASATLSSHRTHHASWNLKDRNGAAVPPGTYTLVMELTDGDQTGRTNALTFDTATGSTTVSPSDAPSFSAMQLQLQ